jgi:Cyclic nucleotide-binding domain
MDGRPHHREGPGTGIGEIALLRSIPRTATVTAVDDVDAWSIDCETFLEAVTGHEGSAAAAREVVETRLHAGAGSGGPGAGTGGPGSGAAGDGG